VETLGISVDMDDRTMHEFYLWPFAEAVLAGTVSIMCSYNRINQTYACENDHILNQALRKGLGFQGYVVSDWFAAHSGEQSIQAGLDVNMPGAYDIPSVQSGLSYWGTQNITRMVAEGLVDESRIDEMVTRLMLPYFYLRQDADFPSVDPTLTLTLATQSGASNLPGLAGIQLPSRDVRADHATLIRKIAGESVILLKNVNKTLPLKTLKDIGVFGHDTAPPTNGIVFEGFYPFEIGTVISVAVRGQPATPTSFRMGKLSWLRPEDSTHMSSTCSTTRCSLAATSGQSIPCRKSALYS
jgi:beta-glucosidase